MKSIQKDFTTLAYSKIRAYSVETAGTFDLESELDLYYSGVGRVRFEFKGSSDILEIVCSTLCNSCRKGKDTTDYDVVIGGIANDKIFKTIDLYFTGDISKEEALNRLKYEKPNNQYCLRTTRALALLSLTSSEVITR